MKSFTELKLSPSLMASITEMGFETPTPIQAQALPILLNQATDFLGLAATGTGKTVAFGIPLLEKINPDFRAVQGLILCPTRELALQVSGQIDLLGKHMGVRALPIYGGAPYHDQIRGLKQGAKIVVGTPGRIIDHLERGTLDLSNLQVVILDEADEMISMGFKEELEQILESAQSSNTQTWLFSATMGREVVSFTERFLNDPQEVRINRTEVVPTRIDQIYYRAHEEDKPEIICKLIEAADEFYGIIFCQTKALVMDLTQYLNQRGYAVDCLHGDMDQNARERAMNGFRNRRSTVLICTDVASRGLDVKDITHVINYSLPRELDNYVHRIGRTARSGKTGVAMNLVTPSHRGLIGRIERVTKSTMREGKLPTRKEIGMKKVSGLLAKFQGETSFQRAMDLLGDSWKSAIENMSREEIAARFLTLTFSDLFQDKGSDKAQEKQEGKFQDTSERGDPRRERSRDRNYDHRSHDQGHGGRERSRERPALPTPLASPVEVKPAPEASEDRKFFKDKARDKFQEKYAKSFGKKPFPQKLEKPKSFQFFDKKKKDGFVGKPREAQAGGFASPKKPYPTRDKAKGKGGSPWQSGKERFEGRLFTR
ncbi:MAG: DEAD/DEAH box helicase [Bdellovibrionia bacterium]